MTPGCRQSQMLAATERQDGSLSTVGRILDGASLTVAASLPPDCASRIQNPTALTLRTRGCVHVVGGNRAPSKDRRLVIVGLGASPNTPAHPGSYEHVTSEWSHHPRPRAHGCLGVPLSHAIGSRARLRRAQVERHGGKVSVGVPRGLAAHRQPWDPLASQGGRERHAVNKN